MSTEYINDLLSHKHSHQIEFHEAVLEIYNDVVKHSNLNKSDIDDFFERIIEPDRTIRFKVEWRDSEDRINVNTGYRIQFNNALGPYKGGLRFHPSVNESIVKFLGFEQVFKNALTGLPMGGAKGGSDFDPKGKTDREIQSFCKSFQTELGKHIGDGVDIPAGDIGVGSTEIAYLFGQHLKMTSDHDGSLTGKSPLYGGVEGRKQATGFGCIYLLEEACRNHDLKLEKLDVLVSGSGNVALHAAEKLIEKGSRVLTLSDSNGTLFFKEGMTSQDLDKVKELKLINKERLSRFRSEHSSYHDGGVPWQFEASAVIPCATQGEISSTHMEKLISNGARIIAEGANKPLDSGAIKMAIDKGIIYLPGKAANAGGVAVSGLEISQNAKRMSTTFEDIDSSLYTIMGDIHKNCSENLDRVNGVIPYGVGANLYSFNKIRKTTVSLWG